MNLPLSKVVPIPLLIAILVTYTTTLSHFIFCWTWRVLTFLLPAHVYQAGEDFLYSLFQRYISFYTEIVTGTKLVLHGDVKKFLERKERVLCISNHQSTVDWIVPNMLAERQGSLSHVRFVLKNSLQWIPIYGNLIYMHSCIFVNRKSFNSNKMLSSLKYLQNKKIPSWIVIYPEGTRYTPGPTKAMERSKKYALDQGLRPFNHVYFPRYRGFYMVHAGMKNNLDALYDLTLFYPDSRGKSIGERKPAPSISDLVSSRCDVHVHIRRIPISEVPKTEECVKQWLYECFRRKENLLENYYNSPLPLPPDHPLSEGVDSPPNRIYNSACAVYFILLALPFFITSYGFTMYLRILFFGSVMGNIWKIIDYIRTFRQRFHAKQD